MKFDVYNDSHNFVKTIQEIRDKYGASTHVVGRVHEALGDKVSYFFNINIIDQNRKTFTIYSAYLSEYADFGLFMYLLQVDNINVNLVESPPEIDIRHIDLG